MLPSQRSSLARASLLSLAFGLSLALGLRLSPSAADPAPARAPGSVASVTSLALGVRRIGSIARPGQVELFSAQLLGRRAYQFRLEAQTLGRRGLRLEVLDSRGERVRDVVDVVRGQRRAFSWPPRTGRVLLRITGLDVGSPTSYALTWDLARDDFANHPRGASRFPSAGTLEGALESFEDEDWFALVLTRGKSYRISYRGTYEVQLVDPGGRRVLARGCAGSLPLFVPPATGTYYLRVPPDRPGRYGVRVRESDPAARRSRR